MEFLIFGIPMVALIIAAYGPWIAETIAEMIKTIREALKDDD